MTVSLTSGATTVVVADIIGAALTRPLRRTADEVPTAAGYLVTAQTPGLLQGTITYLCDTLTDALALDTLYQGTATITLSTGTGNPLNGLLHVAVGALRYTAEKSVNGRPSKWLLQAEIREVTA